MLKKAIVMLALVASTALTYGQGTVNFNTLALKGTGTDPRVLTSDGVTFAAGTDFFAQLYAAPGTAAESALLPVGSPVNLRTGANAGYVQTTGTSTATGTTVNPSVTVTSVSGGPATVQLRAWSSAFATYDAAVTANAAAGKSALLTLSATGAPNGAPPTPDVNLTGLQGFTLSGVPEPSTIALGLIGAGALLIRRRK
jgi:hypothetical protein